MSKIFHIFVMLMNGFVSSNEIINASESCGITSFTGTIHKHTTVRGIFFKNIKHMIIQKKIEVNITYRNKKYYENLGYIVESNSLLINVNDLPKGSNIIIDVTCDVCGIVLHVTNYNYYRYIKRGGIYTCKKCSFKAKTAVTNMEKYGGPAPLSNQSIRDKAKKTNLERYGFVCGLQSEKVKEKTKKTNMEKYGVENSLSSDIIKEKRAKSNIEKYGVENVFQKEDFKKSMIEFKLKNGIITPHELLNEWRIYKLQIRVLTRKFKKYLFDNWDGYDFYDHEFIRDNLKLHHCHRYFPTIDHLVSIFYGFKNNIPPSEIGDIKNLVITKRYINSSKNIKISSQFKLA